MSNLTRRDFIKTTSMAALALAATGLPLGNKKVFAADNCAVKTRYGTFNGFVDENGVKTWPGIPFAQPLKPTNKTFDAKKFGFTACQDIDENENASVNPQSEDCLTLNIWTRGNGKNLPVMVFIHGGGLQTGGSSDPIYHGSNFAAIDSSFADSGYLGMKDHVAALQWVK